MLTVAEVKASLAEQQRVAEERARNQITNDEVDKIIGGWDVSKKHIERLAAEITEYFGAYWVAELPKTDDSECYIFGYQFVRTVPVSSTYVFPPVGKHGHQNPYQKYFDGYDALDELIAAGDRPNVDQRFLIIGKSVTLALRVHWSPPSPPTSRWPHSWAISISGLKILDDLGFIIPKSARDIEAQKRVRQLLLMLKLAV